MPPPRNSVRQAMDAVFTLVADQFRSTPSTTTPVVRSKQRRSRPTSKRSVTEDRPESKRKSRSEQQRHVSMDSTRSKTGGASPRIKTNRSASAKQPLQKKAIPTMSPREFIRHYEAVHQQQQQQQQQHQQQQQQQKPRPIEVDSHGRVDPMQYLAYQSEMRRRRQTATAMPLHSSTYQRAGPKASRPAALNFNQVNGTYPVGALSARDSINSKTNYPHAQRFMSMQAASHMPSRATVPAVVEPPISPKPLIPGPTIAPLVMKTTHQKESPFHRSMGQSPRTPPPELSPREGPTHQTYLSPRSRAGIAVSNIGGLPPEVRSQYLARRPDLSTQVPSHTQPTEEEIQRGIAIHAAQALQSLVKPSPEGYVSVLGQPIAPEGESLPILGIHLPNEKPQISIVRQELPPEPPREPRSYELNEIRVEDQEQFLALPPEIQEAVLKQMRGVPSTLIPPQSKKKEQGDSKKKERKKKDNMGSSTVRHTKSRRSGTSAVRSASAQASLSRGMHRNVELTERQKALLADFEKQIQERQMQHYQKELIGDKAVDMTPQQLRAALAQTGIIPASGGGINVPGTVSAVINPIDPSTPKGSSAAKAPDYSPMKLAKRPVPLIQATKGITRQTNTTAASPDKVEVALSKGNEELASEWSAKGVGSLKMTPDWKRTLLKSFTLSTFVKKEGGSEERVDRTVNLLQLCDDPYIAEISSFLSTEEIGILTKLAEAVGWQSAKDDVSPYCGADYARIALTGHPIIKALVGRLAKFLNVPQENVEMPRLLKYGVGQEFSLHHDGGFRLYSCMVYLTDIPEGAEGGETELPVLGASFRPKAGHAIVWKNAKNDKEEDVRMLHSGTPLKGPEGIIKLCMPMFVHNKAVPTK